MIDEPLTSGTRKSLDLRSVEEVREDLGPGTVITQYVAPTGKYWRPGMGTPILTAETPAAAQAMGRCALARGLKGDALALFGDSIHPVDCGWCPYPVGELLAALDHATWRSQCVLTEVETWTFSGGAHYIRSTLREGEYDNPEWRRFMARPNVEKAREIAEARA